MTKRLKKILSILCALAMLISCMAAGFAEEQPEEADAAFEANGENAGTENPASEEPSEELSVDLPEGAEEIEGSSESNPDEKEGETVSPEPENSEVVSDPVTIQDTIEEPKGEINTEKPADEEPADETPVEQAEEKPADEEPADETPVEQAEEKPIEEEKPAEEEKPETPATSEEEETQEPAEDKEEENGKEPAEEPEEEPEEPEEEFIPVDLDGQRTVSGILTREKPCALSASDAYSRIVVFTLTVAEENVISAAINGTPVTLQKADNPDPASTDVIYTFEKQLIQNQVYSILLTAERDGYVPFTLTLSEKQEKTPEEMRETAEETTEEEAETEETDSGLNEQEQAAEEDNKTQEVQKSVSFEISYDNDTSVFGEFAHFKAYLVGFEDVEYIITWQSSTDGINWNDTDQHDEQMDVEITEENCHLSWRLKVNTLD